MMGLKKKSHGHKPCDFFQDYLFNCQMFICFETTGTDFNAGTVLFCCSLQIRLTAFGAGRVKFGCTGAVGISSSRE